VSDEQRLAQLEAQVLELRSAVTGLAKSQANGSRTVRRVTRESVTREVPRGVGFVRLPPDDEVRIGGGIEPQPETELALANLIPVGATYAYIRFSGHCSGSGVDLVLKHRPDVTGAWSIALHIIPMEDAGDSASNDSAEWVPLTPDQRFRYAADSVGPDPTWSLTLLGYA
jgi:hypothetical protein